MNMYVPEGSLQALINSFKASNPILNISYREAAKLADFFDSLGVEDLRVNGRIFAIQQTAMGAADTIPFMTLQMQGITQDEPLYYHFQHGPARSSSEGTNLNTVGLVKNTIRTSPTPQIAFDRVVLSVLPGLQPEELQQIMLSQPDVAGAITNVLMQKLY